MKNSLLHRGITITALAGSVLAFPASAHADIMIIPLASEIDTQNLTRTIGVPDSIPVRTSTAAITFDTPRTIVGMNILEHEGIIAVVNSPTMEVFSVTPTYTAIITPSQPKISPTIPPTPIPTKIPELIILKSTNNEIQEPKQVTGSHDGMAEQLFSMTNTFRAERGLPALRKDERTCNLAASRAPEVAGEVATGTLHSGLYSRAIPYWNTENIISMHSAEAAFNWWINDKIHHDAIVGNYTYSCVACVGGNCAQEFTNYQPK